MRMVRWGMCYTRSYRVKDQRLMELPLVPSNIFRSLPKYHLF